MIKSNVFTSRGEFLAWVGVLLLVGGLGCQITMARLKRIGTDPKYGPKENTPAALEAAMEHSIAYYARYATIRPYRNGLLFGGVGLIVVCLFLPRTRTRTKRRIILTSITGSGALYSAALMVSVGGNILPSAALGTLSWYLAKRIARALSWDRPLTESFPLNKKREAEFIRHRNSGGMQGIIIAGWAKFAKRDGRVTRHELDVVERWMKAMRFTHEGRLRAIMSFRDAKTGPASFWETAVHLNCWNDETYRPNKQIFVLGLFDLANADGEMSARAEDLLADVCDLYQLPYEKLSQEYQKLRILPEGIEELVARLSGFTSDADAATESTSSPEHKAAYATLGCSPEDSDETIRDRYRNLVRAFHPDALSAKRLSFELLQVAEGKFKEIQAAYEAIRQTRTDASSKYDARAR